MGRGTSLVGRWGGGTSLEGRWGGGTSQDGRSGRQHRVSTGTGCAGVSRL